MFRRVIAPFADRATFLRGGDAVAPGIEAVETFGHAPGHLSHRVESAGLALVILGDVYDHYVFSLQRPAARVFFDDLPEAAAATRRRVIGMLADEDLPAISCLMPFPALGYVERSGDALRRAPAANQFRV